MRKVVIDKTNKLKQIFEKMNYTGHAWMPLDEIDDFLASETHSDYHNPADVEALANVKEAIKAYTDTNILDWLDVALVVIDKAIGGEKDEK